MENSRKRKADCLELHQDTSKNLALHACKAPGVHVPSANVVPENVLQKVPDYILDELKMLRSIFSGSAMRITSAASVEPVLLFVDPQRLPGKAHFGLVAKKDLKRGELIAEEFSHLAVNAVPLHEIEDQKHFKMICRLNHSCAPNVIVQFVFAAGESGPEATSVKYLASRDIEAGEELCKEYFHVCQAFEGRQRLASFVCNCPVCNLTHELRCISDEHRETVSSTAGLEVGSLETAEELHSLLCKIKDARRLMLLEKIGLGSTALKLCRLEMELLQQTKALHPTEHSKFQIMLGKSAAAWEEAVQRECELCEQCCSQGSTMQLDAVRNTCNFQCDAEGEENQAEEAQDEELQLSVHMASVKCRLERKQIPFEITQLAHVESQCRHLGLDASVLAVLDELMSTSEEAREVEQQGELPSVSCEIDMDGIVADDPELQKRKQAEVLACMGDYFAIFRFQDFAKDQYAAALALDTANCCAQLGLAKVLAEK